MPHFGAAAKPAGFFWTEAHGNSMRPTIHDGQRLLVRPLNGRAPAIGSILLCRVGPSLVAHRAVRAVPADGSGLILQGDCALQPDPAVTPSQVVGEVVALIDAQGVRRLDRGAWRWFGQALVHLPLLRHVLVRVLWRTDAMRPPSHVPHPDPRSSRPMSDTSHLPPHVLLSRLVCAAGSPQNRAQMLALLEKYSPDWDLFIKLADAQEISPRAYPRLARFGTLIPDRILTALRNRYAFVAVRSAQQLRETRHVLGEFGNRGVDTIVLKGPLVAEWLGLDAGTRFSYDLDFLVRPAAREHALRILGELGYRHESTYHSPGYRDGVSMRVEVSCPDASSLVELHWNPFPRRPVLFDDEPFWQRSASAAGGAGRARFLSPTDLLLYECIHLRAHGYVGLKYLSDIADLLAKRGDQVDWDELTRCAETNRKRQAVFFALAFSRNIAGAAVPACALERLGSGPAVRRRGSFLNGFQQMTANAAPRSVREVLVELVTADSVRDAARVAWQSLFLDPGERACRAGRGGDPGASALHGAARLAKALREGPGAAGRRDVGRGSRGRTVA